MDFYALLGLPGCLGSIDCVHVGWDGCPAGNRSDSCGKEGFPTLSFQVIVSHTRQIISVSQDFWGTWNDKTIVTCDATIEEIKTNPMYTDFVFRTCTSNGSTIVHKGVYLICDGGYLAWRELIPPFKTQLVGSVTHRWSKWIESLRKDVECLFGILKQRFSCIKNRSRFHDKETIETVFICCCIMHNINHHCDRYADKLHDADESQAVAIFQNNQQEGETACLDNTRAGRVQALAQHFIYHRDVLGKDYVKHRYQRNNLYL